MASISAAPTSFSIRQDDEQPTAPSPRHSRPRGRARSLSDAEASMVDDDTNMADVDDSKASRSARGVASGGEAGEQAGVGGASTGEEGRRASELVRPRF